MFLLLDDELRLLRLVAEELLLLDDLDDDLTVDRELLRLLVDRTELPDRVPEDRVTDEDLLLIPLLTVFDIVLFMRFVIPDPLLRLLD